MSDTIGGKDVIITVRERVDGTVIVVLVLDHEPVTSTTITHRNGAADDQDTSEPAGFAHCPGETAAPLLYAINFMSCINAAQEEATSFTRWLARNRARLGLDEALFNQREISHRRSAYTGPVGRRCLQALREAVALRLNEPAPGGVATSGLATVSATLGFEGLDAASLRRFLIRVNFDHLAPAPSLRLFRNVFGMAPPERLARLDRLTPADFTRLTRRLAALGEMPSEHRLVTLLETEIEAREGKPRGIGFARYG